MSAVPAELRVSSPWREALPAVLVLVAAILLLYRETGLAMIGIWSRSDTFAHAFLVPPISIWLIWRQRAKLAALTPRAQPWMLAALLLMALAWLAADLVAVNAAAQFALVAMIVLSVPAVLGFEVALAILFPLLFLFFAVPFGEFLLPLLMEATADFTVAALSLTGIPVYREGLQFIIPSGSWSVVEACSGVRYLIASLMVGTLFAYLNYRSTKRRVIFIAMAAVVPVLANWVRAYMIVMLGHLSGNKLAVGVDHLIYGWVFFGVVIMIMFVIGARWSEPDDTQAPQAGEAPFAAHADGARGSISTAMAATVLAGMLIAALPPLVNRGLASSESDLPQPRLVLPDRLASAWSVEETQAAAWRPKFHNPSAEAARSYAADGRSVGVYLAYYRGHQPDSKLVTSSNVLVSSDNRQWNQIGSGGRTVAVDGASVSVRTAEVLGTTAASSAARPHLVVWHLYWVGGRWVAGDAAAKMSGAVTKLRGGGSDGAALVLHTDGDSNSASNATLQAFLQANLGLLDALLRQTRDAR